MRKNLPLIAVSLVALLVVAVAIFLFVRGRSRQQDPAQKEEVKLLINALETERRPFVVMAPHESGRLIELYLDHLPQDVQNATLDIEYLAGNLLKGGRVSLQFPLRTPYVQAFLLGSCSAGGKCAFDTDLTSGTLKNRLEFPGQTHVLRSNFVFVNGQVSTPDGRVSYTPSKTSQDGQILVDTQGLPLDLNPGQELIGYPLAISSISDDPIKASLVIRAKEVGSVLIFDGKQYQELPAEIGPDSVSFSLNQAPWSSQAQIIRDDQQGASEDVSVNIFGPIVLVK